MIEQEILAVLADPDDGSRIADIADEFRGGIRDAEELMDLLNSKNSQIVSIGAWVLGELAVELYNSDTIVSRLRELLEHDFWEVRFHALGALFPFLDREDPATRTLLRKLRSDENAGVRKSAEAATARLSLKDS